MPKALHFAFLIIFASLSFTPAMAQSLTGTAFATSPNTLKIGKQNIQLWGTDVAYPLGTTENFQSRIALDTLIGETPIRCELKQSPTPTRPALAQCLNSQERDIALTLIKTGHLILNRAELQDTDFYTPYLQAEHSARQQETGIWNTVNAKQEAPIFTPNNNMSWNIALLFLGVLIAGFTFLALTIKRSVKELITLQKYQIAGTQKRERELKAREKHVVAAALESELNTNRSKLDAYLIIYEELLKSLRDPTKTPKYQRAGDIIHDKPALTRTVYDTNLDKLDLLGTDLASRLATLYQSIDPNPDYRTLEPDMPIEKVWTLVEGIIRNAEKLIDPIDELTGALNVILRDRRPV